MRNPTQSGAWHLLTRRGRQLKTRTDVASFRTVGTLPLHLLQADLAEEVHNLFIRGKYGLAVVQAFLLVEIAVRDACGYPHNLVGRNLMARAFAVADGPLRDQSLIDAERESELFLFSGAIGHAKNPGSHRKVTMEREQAARLIVFASHLLAIVEERARLMGGDVWSLRF
jgi:uncharacterized protein (TIGR02391 family)